MPASRFALITVALALLQCLASCEKEVNIKLNTGEPTLVVEGAIETGLPPYVFLTTSVGYFAKIDLETLQNSFVHGAEVTISNGDTTLPLQEVNIDSAGYQFTVYTFENFLNPPMVGEIEKFYTLTIHYNGQTYTSTTKIPNPKGIDSMQGIAPAEPPENNPDVVQLLIYFSDPDTLGNNFRYFTQRNSDLMYPGYSSVYDDELINGKKDFKVTLTAGGSRASSPNFDSTGFFYKGDTITLKWCAIDRAVFDFYRTYEYAIGTIGSPFASPINVKTNISNGALGIWAGYGATYTTIVVPK